VFDFVQPTPLGSTWGLGGTCVNVGCIPKKLMHQAALLGGNVQDAQMFGWSLSGDSKPSLDWPKMVEAIQSHIGSLNWGYKVALRDKKVKYLNEYARFVDAHTIKGVNKKGKETEYTAQNFAWPWADGPSIRTFLAPRSWESPLMICFLCPITRVRRSAWAPVTSRWSAQGF
jgi:Pyruvate/2-oxoglutarate dehydrogenase complex, dihydrolipoamide dehydrogenase (E3) component, and related enzymes